MKLQNVLPSPTLTTDEVSNLTDTSVTFSGTIEAPTCDPTVTSQGFVYGLSTLPKITDEVIEVNGKVLSKEITGLATKSDSIIAVLILPTQRELTMAMKLMFQTHCGSCFIVKSN